MLDKLKQEIYNYYNTNDIVFTEISSGRSNTNFFITVNNKEYFLRTNITKVSDGVFGGQLKKENDLYKMLKGKSITANIIYYFNDNNLQFIITEKLEGTLPKLFNKDQEKIVKLLNNFQTVDYSKYHFLETFKLEDGFKNLLIDRLSKIKIDKSKKVIEKILDYLYSNNFNIKEKLALCHNDFRSDNIIMDNEAKMIDLEGIVIADEYLDIAEYYIGGIFWNNFTDEINFDFDKFTDFMNKSGYTDTVKQKYIFLLKFATNYSWLAANISSKNQESDIFLEVLNKNTNEFYSNIDYLLD